MEPDLNKLRIDKSRKDPVQHSKWAARWIVGAFILLILLGVAGYLYSALNRPIEVDLVRVTVSGPARGRPVILNATGYIIAAHKIELASKVVGRVAWIGVEKGDTVTEGQEIVRLEDDEYRAQLQQARGQLQALDARLEELENGSRPEEIAVAKANLAQARADLENASVNLARVQKLTAEDVLSDQALDDAQAQYDAQSARVESLERSYELVVIGPRHEQIDAVRGQIEEARGRVAFFETQLDNTIIRAPVAGTILEREVEIGEYVTTSFVGERGAKGYVVSLADLNDLQVELDINQNDFARLSMNQPGVVTTDAFPDREYEGYIEEISPEANREKATVQVKVKIAEPDDYLRPEMNANVAFYNAAAGAPDSSEAGLVVYVPTSAVRGNAVFLHVDGRAIRREVRTGGVTAQGIRIDDGLYGGEDLITNPPSELSDGDRVRPR